jgi:hypothetical protein
VPRIGRTNSDILQDYDDESSVLSADIGGTPMEKTVMSRTARTSQMFDDDAKFRQSIIHTQEQQKLDVKRLLKTNLSKHSIAQTIMRETLKTVENHQYMFEMYVKDLKQLELKFTRMVVEENASEESMSSVSTVIGSCDQSKKRKPSGGLCSAQTGRSYKKKEKRLTSTG